MIDIGKIVKETYKEFNEAIDSIEILEPVGAKELKEAIDSLEPLEPMEAEYSL